MYSCTPVIKIVCVLVCVYTYFKGKILNLSKTFFVMRRACFTALRIMYKLQNIHILFVLYIYIYACTDAL